MRKLNLYWMSNPDWWTFENHIPVVKIDAPLEAQESYQMYLQQTSGEKIYDNTKNVSKNRANRND